LGTAVNQLDIVVLSALEIDINYNVNVLTGSDGMIRGAIGGHPDTAAGASMTIIVAPLIRGRIPTVVERVNTVVTPGNTVDVLVTDQGIAVNARRMDIKENLKQKGIRVCSIEELRDRAEKIVGIPKANAYEENVVGVVAYRDNTIIDLIQQIKQS
jgi:citrate lyase subunit alpha/citrate CoA-transferase